jgi:NAD-dependent dihydropyrimidine dehydrogenase PreA subunit
MMVLSNWAVEENVSCAYETTAAAPVRAATAIMYLRSLLINKFCQDFTFFTKIQILYSFVTFLLEIKIKALNLLFIKNNAIILAYKKQHLKLNKMAYKITEDCVACGTCIGECPTGAISEGDIYKIDPNTCIDCGTCASACPMGAIVAGE